MKISIHPVDLHLRERFTTHIDSRIVQHSHIIKIEHEGLVGIGEVTAHPFYKISREKILKDFHLIKNKIEQYKYDDPESFWEYLSPSLLDNKFLLSGIDVASNDLYGKMHNLSLSELWEIPQPSEILCSYTIGIDEISIMADKLQATPWPVYKIKLGTDKDVEIIETLRRYTSSAFRIDANCAWNLDQLERYTTRFKEMNVELIEQPIHPNSLELIKQAKAISTLPIIADESFKTMEDLSFCSEYYHGINIKLVKCGGLTPARKIILAAKQKGLSIMLGCMTESSISISAASQLVSLVDYADLDGALLLQNDIAKGTTIIDGKIGLTNKPGIGCELIPSGLD